MDNSIKNKMDYAHKKKINSRISKIKDKDVFQKIFEVSKSELYTETGKKKFSHNNNGIFFDLNILSDKVLYKIEDILNENIVNSTESETPTSIKFSTYSQDDTNNYKSLGPRLTNQEKNIIKNTQNEK